MSDTIKKHIKDPGSAITHFIGMLMAIFAAVPLLIKAAQEPERIYVISIAVYAASLILLYAASTTYHTFDTSEKAFSSPEVTLQSVCLFSTEKLVFHFWHLSGESQLSAFCSKLFGYIAQNGFLLFCISAWAGLVFLHLHRFLIPCHLQHLDGSLPADLFTP